MIILSLIGSALLAMIQGILLIVDRNRTFKTPFKLLLDLHLKALDYQHQQLIKELEKIIIRKEEITKQEILIDTKMPWKY